MSLIPNQPFGQGQPFTPELADLAFNTPVFDGQKQYLGHRDPLQDHELSSEPGQLKARVTDITEALKVTEVSGLTVAVAPGIAIVPTGETFTLSGQQLTLEDNTTLFIWVNEAGEVESGPQAPAIRLMLAAAVTSGGAVSVITDLRSLAQRPIQPVAKSIRVFGGSNTTDYTATQGDVLDQGIYYFRNFTVPQGIAITVDKFARIVCSGKVDIQGRIDVERLPAGALALEASVTDQEVGFTRGGGIGGGGASYPFALQPYGSGGALGGSNSPSGGTGRIGEGGDCGGSLAIEASGPIIIGSSARIIANGGRATDGDARTGECNISGSGGGSGGLIYFSSLVSVTAQAACTLDVSGGDGSNADRRGNAEHASGGGGGSGGVIVFSSPDNNSTAANIILNGGVRGSDSGSPSRLGGGSGGGFGGTCTAGQDGPNGRLIIRNFVPIG